MFTPNSNNVESEMRTSNFVKKFLQTQQIFVSKTFPSKCFSLFCKKTYDKRFSIKYYFYKVFPRLCYCTSNFPTLFSLSTFSRGLSTNFYCQDHPIPINYKTSMIDLQQVNKIYYPSFGINLLALQLLTFDGVKSTGGKEFALLRVESFHKFSSFQDFSMEEDKAVTRHCRNGSSPEIMNLY